MYVHSKYDVNIKEPVRQIRTVNKIVFETATKCKGKYLNRPFHNGTLLWNKLDADIPKSYNLVGFMAKLKGLYAVYQEIS